MMLKDIFEKYMPKKSGNLSDKIASSLMDGYVDIKAYKVNNNGTKDLVYHDTGDNVVTDWMRQTILMLLSGYCVTANGAVGTEENKFKSTQPSVSEGCHSTNNNIDGYLLNGEQFFWERVDNATCKQPVSGNYVPYESAPTSTPIFPVFPTKVLFGTGREFSSWEDLKSETSIAYPNWYAKMAKIFEGIENASSTSQAINECSFKKYISPETQENTYCGIVSSTTGEGGGSLLKSVTVNDPEDSSDTSSTADMAKRYGVTGAIKTIVDNPTHEALNKFASDAGVLVNDLKAGVGNPCFIYFNRTSKDEAIQEDWSDVSGAEIYLSKDSTKDFLNRITFKIKMPSQSSGSGHINEYYPYNGYTLKQVGLFNDSILIQDKTGTTGAPGKNMQWGTLLAIKNIEPFTKTADEEIVLTWTLTI